MRSMLTLQSKTVGLIGTVVAVTSGCQSPLVVERQEIREARMQQVSTWHAELAKERADHLTWLGKTQRELDVWRAQTLDKTTGYVEERIRHDWKHWQETAPVRRAWLQYLVEARPESIEHAAIHIFY